MSEERLRPELDGTGGGYGKFAGMTVRQMSEQFDRIAADPAMRSFTAVLRISREQIEARGQFSINYILLFVFAVISIGCVGAYPFLSSKTQHTVLAFGLASLLATAAFAAGVASSGKHARASMAQERAIRELAVDTLVRIANEPGFKAKSLDFTQRRFLAELLRKTKRDEPRLSAVIDLGEAK